MILPAATVAIFSSLLFQSNDPSKSSILAVQFTLSPTLTSVFPPSIIVYSFLPPQAINTGTNVSI